MQNLDPHRIQKFIVPGAIIMMFLAVISITNGAEDIFLSPPGLRPVADPALVIPADYRYRNARVKLPAYRDDAGAPANGWSKKFVSTRRFMSNKSAWIYFRKSDFEQSAATGRSADKGSFRFWPVGATFVIESYKGTARHSTTGQLMEIDVMVKVRGRQKAFKQAFHPVNWAYARFNPDGRFSATSVEVNQCHQCHSIAFHLTGDLIFTRFP